MGVSVGKSATFYQDVFGRLVDMDNDVRIVYGYLTKMAREGAFGAVQCKIFTENDRFVTLAMSSKLKFNGNTGVDALTVAQTLGWQQEEYQQLITYRVNDEAEIIELNTAQSYEPCSEEEEQAIRKMYFGSPNGWIILCITERRNPLALTRELQMTLSFCHSSGQKPGGNV